MFTMHMHTFCVLLECLSEACAPVHSCVVSSIVAKMQKTAPIDAAVLQTVRKQIKKGGDTGELITCWEDVLATLQGAGLAWRQRTMPQFVAEHPQNRS